MVTKLESCNKLREISANIRQLAKSLGKDPFREANSLSASQEIPHIILNLKVPCRVRTVPFWAR